MHALTSIKEDQVKFLHHIISSSRKEVSKISIKMKNKILIAMVVWCGVIAAVHAGPYEKEEPQERDIRATEGSGPLSATVKCSETYKLGNDVTCTIRITNNEGKAYTLLKRNTPLEGLQTDFLSVTQNGVQIQYDGKFIKRDSKPSPGEYVTIRGGGQTRHHKIVISDAYGLHKAGLYKLQLNTEVVIYRANVRGRQMTMQLTSEPITFSLTGSGAGKLTEGEKQRKKSFQQNVCVHQDDRSPCEPQFLRGTEEQQETTRQIHRAAFHYISAALIDIDDNRDHYVTWFGAVDAQRIQFVKDTYGSIYTSMNDSSMIYTFDDPGCGPGYYAYTHFGSDRIHLCAVYMRADSILGVDTKLQTIAHEFTHILIRTLSPEIYGRRTCLDLARDNPSNATKNAENYGYFIETLNIFDYGFDSLFNLSNSKTYVTRGNIFLQYSDVGANVIDSGFPKLISGRFGDGLPENFIAGFDSMASLPNGRVYSTKDFEFVRYLDGTATTVDPATPASLSRTWGKIPETFKEGFDSMSILGDGIIRVTKGGQYVVYADISATVLRPGFPKSIQGRWGNIPDDFNAGFDSMSLLRNGKTVVTKGKQYVRYSDSAAFVVDPGYPKPIKGNWGTINFPGPH